MSEQHEAVPPIDPEHDLVLITGAAGAIGTALRAGMRKTWRRLRLTDIGEVPDLAENEQQVIADIGNRASLERMMQGVSAVVHLAGAPGDHDLETLFRVNVRGLFDVFEAARLEGVKRIVFASSNHAFGCYPIEVPVSPDMPPRPDSLYGAFKVMGETMLRTYHERHGIASVSLRIGTYRPLPIDQRSLATWLSPRDVTQLVERALLHPDPGCLVVNGYSANTRIKTHDPNWAFLGYAPQDNAEDHLPMLREQGIHTELPWEYPLHGGIATVVPERPAKR